MKEVTYEEWQKNTTPRMMWVWNVNVDNKVQAKVIYVIKHDVYAVITVIDKDVDLLRYKHCAEIEEIKESKTRRMTNKELSRWLREKPTREWKCKDGNSVCSVYGYGEKRADEEVRDIFIREDDGEWHEPLAEVEE